MSEIKIPFNKWSKDRLKAGVKTATSRTKKYGVVGDVFVVDGVSYELEIVSKVSLQTVLDVAWDVEGAKSKDEFVEVWESIHPRRGFVSDDKVWFHRFKRLD